jgi:hypothetical protein
LPAQSAFLVDEYRLAARALVTLDAALTKIVKPLAEIDIVLTDAEHERIFAV